MNAPDATCIDVEADELHEVGTVLVAQVMDVAEFLVVPALQGVHRVRDIAGFGVGHLLVCTARRERL